MGALIVSSLAAGCGQRAQVNAPTEWTPEATAELGPVVARVGDVPVFAREVAAQAARTSRPPDQALDDLIRFHLLAERARAAGASAASPEVVQAWKQALVQRLLERDLEPKLGAEDVPEADLRTLYERNRDYFVHPRLVEVIALSVFTGARMKPEPRARARKTALELHAHIQSRPGRTVEDFSAIAADPAWMQRKVRMSRTWQGPDKPFSAVVGAEVAKLTRPGDTTPLVEDEDGYHVARYIAERPPRNTAFAEAREEIARSYFPSWRTERFTQFAQKLAATHGAETHASRLSAPPP